MIIRNKKPDLILRIGISRVLFHASLLIRAKKYLENLEKLI
jgi:hypothetical protein